MKLFYIFISFLVLLFVGTIVYGAVIDTWSKMFATRISEMSNHEMEERLSILLGSKKKCLSLKEKLEYEMLLKKIQHRQKK